MGSDDPIFLPAGMGWSVKGALSGRDRGASGGSRRGRMERDGGASGSRGASGGSRRGWMERDGGASRSRRESAPGSAGGASSSGDQVAFTCSGGTSSVNVFQGSERPAAQTSTKVAIFKKIDAVLT